MRFLFIQVIIVILVCIFIAALSNLTEMGIIGWIIAGSTGHALYRIYKHMHYSYKTSGTGSGSDTNKKCPTCNSRISGFSEQIQSFMFDDATQLHDD